jgi:Zinc dependent phospholipase C
MAADPRPFQRSAVRYLIATVMCVPVTLSTRPAAAYSVVAHLDAVDVMWNRQIAGLLQQRFGHLTAAQLKEARAYSYGGALIQDLGYYPFGSQLFTNLTHYVRSGDFIRGLLHDAADPDEYAFALGALAHYAFDNVGHPMAVNPGVPMMYPKVRAKVGPRALYVDSPARHIMVEFAFDVVQVARGGYVAQDYRDRIGFEVSKPLLARAFRETYGLELDDVFTDVDLAIATYRHAVGTTIPDLTRIAWREKHEEIERRTPDVNEHSFVYALTKRDYDQQFGGRYRKPSLLARTIGVMMKILPRIGPLKPLAFEPLTADVEAMFDKSITAARGRYRNSLEALREHRLELPNMDFDTGRAPERGANRLADKTYADWLHRLAKEDQPSGPAISRDLHQFFGEPSRTNSLSSRKMRRVREDLARLGR